MRVYTDSDRSSHGDGVAAALGTARRSAAAPAEDLVTPIQRLVLRDGIFGSSVERELKLIRPGTSRGLRRAAAAVGHGGAHRVPDHLCYPRAT